jgi:hypothetical protein
LKNFPDLAGKGGPLAEANCSGVDEVHFTSDQHHTKKIVTVCLDHFRESVASKAR